ncbi:MAG: hypothetical protein SP4CHLAM5_05810 [Chlamydiia bacterium]|nr:hypothetical protein [Chlamydiia bacterium]
MIETILRPEAELCKMKDPSRRQAALIYSRATQIAKYSEDERCLQILIANPLAPIPGFLGHLFANHLDRCLHFFLKSKEFQNMCKRLPGSLVPSYKEALLIPLRQSVGSCFATAFLMHLQKTDLLALAKDLFSAINRGGISRVIDGAEIKIPLCPKTGNIEYCSALMKSYEYTVAGLADEQVGFSRWNFQIALGLDYKMDHGLGKVIYSVLEEILEECKGKMDGLLQDIEDLERGLDMDDASFRSASTIDRMDSIKRAAKFKNMHLSRIIDDYQREEGRASKLSTLYKFFVEQYILLFPHYFQELYDPLMFSEGDIMEDRPAGFRLVYKHGRSNSKMWTYIHTDKEYIACLKDFITMTEPVLLNLKREEGIDKEMEQIISEMLLKLDTHPFLKEQKNRIQLMHKEVLGEDQNLSPYAYISGGNLESLVNTYLMPINPIKKENVSAASPSDLCYRLIEWMKDTPISHVDAIDKDPFQGMLMTNDTHAFHFLPGFELFKGAWMDSGNTYTYIRDVLLQSKTPIPFADTNWGANFLAFLPVEGTSQLELVLYDGFTVTPFPMWNSYFVKGAIWNIYLC